MRHRSPAPGHLFTAVVCLALGVAAGWASIKRRLPARASQAAQTTAAAAPVRAHPGDYLRDTLRIGKAKAGSDCAKLAEEIEHRWGRGSSESATLLFTLLDQWCDPERGGDAAGAAAFVKQGHRHLGPLLWTASARFSQDTALAACADGGVLRPLAARAAGLAAGRSDPPAAEALASLPPPLRRAALSEMWRGVASRTPEFTATRALAADPEGPRLPDVFPALADAAPGRAREIAVSLPRVTADMLLLDWIRLAPSDMESWAALPATDPPAYIPRKLALALAELNVLRPETTRTLVETRITALEPMPAHALRARHISLLAADDPETAVRLMEDFERLSTQPEAILRVKEIAEADKEQVKAVLAGQLRTQRQQFFRSLASADPAAAFRWLMQRLKEDPQTVDFAQVPVGLWNRQPATSNNSAERPGDVLPEDGLVLIREWLRRDPQSALREVCAPAAPAALRRMFFGVAALPGEFAVPLPVLEKWAAAESAETGKAAAETISWLREPRP